MEFLKAIGGIAILMAGWFAVQAYIRRSKGMSADQDTLEHLVDGCACCDGTKGCHSAPRSEIVSIEIEKETHQCQQ
jgi:hypothetical protein